MWPQTRDKTKKKKNASWSTSKHFENNGYDRLEGYWVKYEFLEDPPHHHHECSYEMINLGGICEITGVDWHLQNHLAKGFI